MKQKRIRGWGSQILAYFAIIFGFTLLFTYFLSEPQIINGESNTLYAQSENELYRTFIPLFRAPPAPDPLPPPVPFAAAPPIDFSTVRINLQQQGLDLAFNKIGFHTGFGGNVTGLHEWMTTLDEAGIPIVLKSVDDPSHLYFAQQLMQQSGVPHILIFRRTGAQYDVPNYDLPPREAAQQHWALHKAAWPSELDPSLVWIETVNEVDKNRTDWLAEFALETAHLAIADGYKWAAFGWSSGEPEPSHWESPKMREFLDLAGNYPEQIAIALHEYSYDLNIGNGYPFLVGRFQALFQVCDDYDINRPTVLITEWGWNATQVPAPSEAMAHIEWAAWFYAAYPQVKGVAIWYLGGGFGGIADQAQQLIVPVRDYSLSHYFGYTPGQGSINPILFHP